jgi:hypothetical protein
VLSRRRFLALGAAGIATAACPLPVRALAGAPASVGRSGAALVGIRIRREADWAILRTLDVAECRHGDLVHAVLWRGDDARLAKAGFEWVVIEGDLAAASRRDRAIEVAAAASQLPGSSARIAYRRLADYDAELAGLAAAYPGHVRTVQGAHATLEGRAVNGVEIAGGVAAVDGRPTFFIMGLHHAREWPSAEVTMDAAIWLASSYGVDAELTALLDQVRVLVVPVVNADGFNHSREFELTLATYPQYLAGNDEYWRKNRRGVAAEGAMGGNPTAYGVDPNRNYGYWWGEPGSDYTSTGSSSVPTDQTYHGTAAFSEPETQNIRDWVLSRHVTMLITNHTYSRLVLWPWGNTHTPAPDAPALRDLGRAMAAINGYWPMQSINLYPTNGTTDDWSYAVTGAYSYTFEMGTSFHPAYTNVFPRMTEENIGAFLVALRSAADPAHHSRITGRVVDAAGAAVGGATLRLVRTSKIFDWIMATEDTVDTTTLAAPDGTFDWHVGPSKPPGQLSDTDPGWQLSVSAGGRSASRLVTVRRGELAALGDITVV